jgi:hypothetical protein
MSRREVISRRDGTTPAADSPIQSSARWRVGEDAPPRGLAVRHCASGPLVLLRADLNTSDSTGHYQVVEEDCESHADAECTFRDLKPGRYRIAQGAFSAVAAVDALGEGATELNCDTSCTHIFDIRVVDGCASRALLSLSSAQPVPWAQQLTSAAWDGTPIRLEGLPCGTLALDVEGQGCAPYVRQIASDGLHTSHAVELVRGTTLELQIQDARTSAPIPSAEVTTTAWFRPARTDANGHVSIWLGRERVQAAIILAQGYAGYDLLWSDIPWTDGGRPARMTIQLQPTFPLRIRCTDGEQNCPPDTFVRVYHSGQNRERVCALEEDGVNWLCPAADGDRVVARLGTRRTPPIPIVSGGGQMTVQLPEADAYVCFMLPVGERCEVQLTGGGSTYRQYARSGELVAIDPKLTEPLVAVRCGTDSWFDVLDPAETDACLVPSFVPGGGVCVPRGRDCTIRALEPRWNIGVQRLSPCASDLPIGRYLLSCGANSTEIDVETGATSELE